MDLADFDRTALEIVTEFGGDASYVKAPQSSYDPVQGKLTGTPTSVPVKAAIMDLTLQSNGMSLKYGTQIIAGDKEAYVIPPSKLGGPVLTITPGSDKLVVGGVSYTVVTFKEVNPSGDNPVIYFLYLRR